MLEQAGADVTFQWHPGSHGLGMEDVQAAQAWLNERLKAKG
jgi:predicted esterase